MNQDGTIWAFDLGKASIGEAVRRGTKFLHKASLLIPAEFAETKTAAGRRRMWRTRQAHKAREQWLNEVMREVEREGIERDTGKILVQAHADVIDILAIDERETLDQLERRHRKQIFLQAVTDFHPEQFEVSSDKKVEPRTIVAGRTVQGETVVELASKLLDRVAAVSQAV